MKKYRIKGLTDKGRDFLKLCKETDALGITDKRMDEKFKELFGVEPNNENINPHSLTLVLEALRNEAVLTSSSA